jgi:tetratricopeptide (TPR) repeat protein
LNKEDSGEEKWQLVRSLIARKAPSPAARARLLNTWAWECYERDDRSLLGEADDASREALELIPDDASLLDTRGHVLVWAGRHAEARALLLRAFELASTPEGRAYVACGLSLASASAGDRVDAEQWLTKARELSPALPFLDRVAKLLSESAEV